MKTQKVTVLSYQTSWRTDFEKIAEELRSELGDQIIGIEHVGSTSVTGLSAKPIIDIDIVIQSEDDFEGVKATLAVLGYQHEGDLGISGREAFRYTDKPYLQKHHLYVCSQDSKELHRHLAFRDYLRTHPEAVDEYSYVKEQGAARYPNDIEKYMTYKSTIIEELYQRCGLEK